MKVNWWLIAALELVLLLLIFTGFGLAYLSSSNKLLIDNNMQNIIHETKKEDEYSLVKRNMSDKFTLEGVKVEISRIGYDRFLSTIIGSLGDIEEINIAEYTGIHTTQNVQGDSEQQLYVLTTNSKKSDQVIVITVTNDGVTVNDISAIIEQVDKELILHLTPTVKIENTKVPVNESLTQTPTNVPAQTPLLTPDPANFGDCIDGCVSEERFK